MTDLLPMSALRQKRTFWLSLAMSPLLPKADIRIKIKERGGQNERTIE
jgi:hypothetical protein